MAKFLPRGGKSEGFPMKTEYILTAGVLVGVVALALALAWWVGRRSG
jgi:hypothetical protein